MDEGRKWEVTVKNCQWNAPDTKAETLHQWSHRERNGHNRRRGGAALGSEVSGWGNLE